MVKAEDIVFWILILIIIAVALWLAFGSPNFESSLLMIIIFVAGSEILLWRSLFSIDKRSSVGFEKVKLSFDRVNDKLEVMNNSLISLKDDVNEMKFLISKKFKK